MNLPELCIRRPVMTTLVMAAFVVFGLLAYRSLPVSELPSVDFPTIAVSGNVPGASAETMASAVATPLEQAFSTIAGVDSISSVSAQGLTQITLQFALERNVDLPTGVVEGSSQSVSVRATGQLESAAAYRPLVVAYRNGAPVRLDDVGSAIDSVENLKASTWYKGERAIVLAILRQPGANTI